MLEELNNISHAFLCYEHNKINLTWLVEINGEAKRGGGGERGGEASTAQHSTAQQSTAQHSRAQHSRAKHTA